MSAEFKMPLPENCGVETVTLIAYEDDRPTEAVFAGTGDDNIKHVRFTRSGSGQIVAALTHAILNGVDEVLFDGPADAEGE